MTCATARIFFFSPGLNYVSPHPIALWRLYQMLRKSRSWEVCLSISAVGYIGGEWMAWKRKKKNQQVATVTLLRRRRWLSRSVALYKTKLSAKRDRLAPKAKIKYKKNTTKCRSKQEIIKRGWPQKSGQSFCCSCGKFLRGGEMGIIWLDAVSPPFKGRPSPRAKAEET